MAQKRQAAQAVYEAAVNALRKYCEDHTDLDVYILDETYPIRVQFIPTAQQSLFRAENVDENGEVNDLTVTVGLSTSLKSTLKFKMDDKLLKKLIKMAGTVGAVYYQAFREQEGERMTPKRPFMKEMDGFTADEASELVCPNCEHAIVNQWAPGNKPQYCQGCGQRIDWSDEQEAGEE